MHKPKLLESYLYLTNPEVAPFAGGVVRQTAASVYITKGADAAKPLADALALYNADLDAHDHLSPTQTAVRDELRVAVVTELGRLAKNLNLDYPGNEVSLLSSGLPLANANTAARAGGTADVKPIMALQDSKTAHYLTVVRDFPTGSVQGIVRFTTDTALDERYWEVEVGSGTEVEIGPFLRKDEVRARTAVLTTSTKKAVYSDVVSRIVQ